MESFVHECVSIQDVCQHNNLDYDDVMEKVSNSNVSFGTNADTLIHGYMLNAILHSDLDFNDFDNDILISLGS